MAMRLWRERAQPAPARTRTRTQLSSLQEDINQLRARASAPLTAPRTLPRNATQSSRTRPQRVHALNAGHPRNGTSADNDESGVASGVAGDVASNVTAEVTDATVAGRRSSDKKTPQAGGPGVRDGRGSMVAPVAAVGHADADARLAPEMDDGGGAAGDRVADRQRPVFTAHERQTGRIHLADFSPFGNNISTPALERYLASLESWAAESARDDVELNRQTPASLPPIAFMPSRHGQAMCGAFKHPGPLWQAMMTQQHWYCCEREGPMQPVCYQKMPKAASSSMHSALARLYTNCSTLVGGERVPELAPRDAVFVTSTREPWAWMRSAYAEVDGWMSSLARRRRRRNKDKGTEEMDPRFTTRFFRMHRRDEPARFLAFIDDVFNFRFGGTQSAVFYARHAHPQISQVLGMPRINAVVRTETLERDWARLLDTLGVPTARRVRVSTTNVAGKLLDAEDIQVIY